MLALSRPWISFEPSLLTASTILPNLGGQLELWFRMLWRSGSRFDWMLSLVSMSSLSGHFCLQAHESGKIILFADKFGPFKEHLFELEEEQVMKVVALTKEELVIVSLLWQGIQGEVLFAVFADTNKSWRVMAVNHESQVFVPRLKLPDKWCGLRAQELSEVSGIPGCIFVHAAGFIGGNETMEGAMMMAVKTCELSGSA